MANPPVSHRAGRVSIHLVTGEPLRDLHRRTMRHSVGLVAAIGDHQWDLPTPCGQWTARDLLVHMIRENRGFAAAAAGETVDRSAWTSPVGDDPRAEYAESADQVVEAFGAPGALDREFWLPLIAPDTTFAGQRAAGFHLLDYLVHGWDVAVTIGRPTPFEADLIAAVTEIAHREVPDGPRRHRPDASFAPPVDIKKSAGALDRLLGYLGRDPGWRG